MICGRRASVARGGNARALSLFLRNARRARCSRDRPQRSLRVTPDWLDGPPRRRDWDGRGPTHLLVLLVGLDLDLLELHDRSKLRRRLLVLGRLAVLAVGFRSVRRAYRSTRRVVPRPRSARRRPPCAPCEPLLGPRLRLSASTGEDGCVPPHARRDASLDAANPLSPNFCTGAPKSDGAPSVPKLAALKSNPPVVPAEFAALPNVMAGAALSASPPKVAIEYETETSPLGAGGEGEGRPSLVNSK